MKELTPQKRIHVSPLKEGKNPLYIGIAVADGEARDAVNKYASQPWVKGDSISIGDKDLIIKADKYHGYFIMNECFNREDVVNAIESALGDV